MTFSAITEQSHTEEELSPTFDEVKRASIVNNSGLSYRDLRSTLTPHYIRAWIELLAGHCALVLLFVGFLFVGEVHARWTLPLYLLGSILVGYVYAYIQLFFHEASHYNLSSDRTRNDLLANLFIGPLAGLDIAQYRKIHFEHHRHLGTTKDPERSYFRPLNLRFIVESLSGVQVWSLINTRAAEDSIPQYDLTSSRGRRQLLGGLLINGSIVLFFLFRGDLGAALAWGAGVLLFFPFFTALRQLLEHRSDTADPFADYAKIDHGETHRMFGEGPLASTLGNAGFNRHFLHHWDPQLSYTRLRDVERFLMETPLRNALQGYRTTYVDTFLKLFDPRWY